MTEVAKKEETTLTVVITIRGRAVTVEGENLHTLRNSVIHNIEKNLKKAARVAKRNYLRPQRVAPIIEGNESVKVDEDDTPKLTINEALANIGIKLKT